MKSFKSVREGNSVEPGVSEINDVQDDPLSYVEIKPKKVRNSTKAVDLDEAASAAARFNQKVKQAQSAHEAGDHKKAKYHLDAARNFMLGINSNDHSKIKDSYPQYKKLRDLHTEEVVVEETMQEAITVKKDNYSWGKMMTVHHGSNTSYPLHPEHQAAIKKLRPGMKTTFKDETNSTVHAHREGDTVHLTRPKTGSTLTSLPYHHFDTSEHAKPAAKKPAGEYDRKVTDHLKKKYNESQEVYAVKQDYSYIKNDMERLDKEMKNTRSDMHNEDTVLETKGAPKGFHFTKDGKLKRGDANQDGDGGTMLRADPLDKQRNKVPAVSEGINLAAIWYSIKPVHEEVKTTHEDPLVVTRDSEGNIHTHANLSVANAIHGTDVKHQAIHSGKPVQGGKFTFELSKHHEGALKEDAPFDPVAHKKEADRLMAKHIEAHKAVSKAFADIKAKGGSPSFDIPENKKLNDIKKEIAQHKAKVPSGPAPKPGSAADYYASKKPGEYTGD